jgi:hypothetical protein
MPVSNISHMAFSQPSFGAEWHETSISGMAWGPAAPCGLKQGPERAWQRRYGDKITVWRGNFFLPLWAKILACWHTERDRERARRCSFQSRRTPCEYPNFPWKQAQVPPYYQRNGQGEDAQKARPGQRPIRPEAGRKGSGEHKHLQVRQGFWPAHSEEPRNQRYDCGKGVSQAYRHRGGSRSRNWQQYGVPLPASFSTSLTARATVTVRALEKAKRVIASMSFPGIQGGSLRAEELTVCFNSRT